MNMYIQQKFLKQNCKRAEPKPKDPNYVELPSSNSLPLLQNLHKITQINKLNALAKAKSQYYHE